MGEKLKYTDILFDMDGTLNESGPGIIASFKYAMNKLNMPLADDADLNFVIGPPLDFSFKKLNVDKENIKTAISYYRDFFTKEGMYINSVYDGIEDVLKELIQRGYTLHIATSKPDILTKEILIHFDLLKYFNFIAACTMDEKRTTKDEVIAYALENLSHIDKSNILMIGDRYHDIEGAKINGIDSMGVLYGYGDRAELENAGADYIAQTPKDILNFL